KVHEAPGGGDSLDYFHVGSGTVQFSLCRVPEDFAPGWARGISINYRAPIPSHDVREAVAELTSFVLGRRLMSVGSTSFDESGAAVEQDARCPFGQGIARICRTPDAPPIYLHEPSDDAERVIETLLPAYLAAREPLGLADALLIYW